MLCKSDLKINPNVWCVTNFKPIISHCQEQFVYFDNLLRAKAQDVFLSQPSDLNLIV